MKQYDIAAYIWPSYTGDEPRTRIFWPQGQGEWETVRQMTPRFEGHPWPRKPLWGYVNEADPAVMEQQIEAAAAHGVNVFIYDWYWYDRRPFLENCLNDGYLKAGNNDKVKFYLMWANHTADSGWDRRTADLHVPIWDGAVDRPTFETVVQRLITRYFTHPSYYKIDGKPVLMLYDIPNFVRGLGGVDAAARAVAYFREQVQRAGFPGLELQAVAYGLPTYDGPLGEGIDENRLAVQRRLGFDSATNYQFVHMTGVARPYGEVLEDVKQCWEQYPKKLGIPYYPHVSVGWDANPRFKTFDGNILRDNTPENVEQAFRAAKVYIDAHPELPAPLITVNSWNEWTEGSYLEPDDLYGYGYLEAIRRVFLPPLS